MSESGDIRPFERVFNLIGWIGFLFAIPILLSAFGVTEPSKWLESGLGMWGSTGFLLIYFYALQLLRTFFGSGRIITPLIVGGLMSFVIISASIPIGFMEWFRNLLMPLGWFAGNPFAVVIGFVTIILGYLLSYLHRLHALFLVLLLVVLPAGLVALSYYLKLANLLGLAPAH